MDGVHLLRKRQHTRLWYRALPATAQPAVSQPPASSTDSLARAVSAALDAAWAELARAPLAKIVPLPAAVDPPVPVLPEVPESLRQTRRLQPPAPVVKPAPTRVTAPLVAEADEWRTVPSSAPSLLLSATDLLDACNPGPVLRPGARYRIAGVQNGIVGLYVTEPDGESGLGFCAAVDLICIDARFNRYKVGGPTPSAFKHPSRSRMQRFTGGLSQATTSLLGAASGSR